jgi:hypothetical protein
MNQEPTLSFQPQTHQHLSDDQLIEQLYSGEFSAGDCADCSERWQQLGERRAASVQILHPEPAFFVRQREQILQRISGQKDRGWWQDLLAAKTTWLAAAACVAGLTVMVSKPYWESRPIASESITETADDAALFEELNDLAAEAPAAAVSVNEFAVDASD